MKYKNFAVFILILAITASYMMLSIEHNPINTNKMTNQKNVPKDNDSDNAASSINIKDNIPALKSADSNNINSSSSIDKSENAATSADNAGNATNANVAIDENDNNSEFVSQTSNNTFSDSSKRQKEPESKILLPSPVAAAAKSEFNSKSQEVVGVSVSPADMAQIAAILIKRLSISEIKYIFDSSSSDYWVNTPVEEIESVRNILMTKLNSSELDILRTIGKKYGKGMMIIDPTIKSVADKKAEIIAQRNKQQTNKK